jgi:hypothetical protein
MKQEIVTAPAIGKGRLLAEYEKIKRITTLGNEHVLILLQKWKLMTEG